MLVLGSLVVKSPFPQHPSQVWGMEHHNSGPTPKLPFLEGVGEGAAPKTSSKTQ